MTNGRYDITFEPSSIFITLPPGISISQVIDKTECCHLREAHTCIGPSSRNPDAGAAHAGLKGQYTDGTPTNNFPNGHGMRGAKSAPTRGQSSSAPSGSRPTYCPPHRPRQARGIPSTHPESDVEMVPAQTDDTKHPKRQETHNQPATREHCEDVPMECVATVLDPEDDNTHDPARDSQHNNDNTDGHSTPIADSNLATANPLHNQSLQPEHHTRDGHARSPITPNAVHLHHKANGLTDHQEVANVGYPRLSNTLHSIAPANLTPFATVEPLQPDQPDKGNDAPQRPTRTCAIPQDANPIGLADSIAGDSTSKYITPKDHSCSISKTASLPAQKCRQSNRQTSRSNNGLKNGSGQPTETVLDLLAHNTAYQQLDNKANEPTASDDVIFVKATHNPIVVLRGGDPRRCLQGKGWKPVG